ncbi:DNA-directed RNA polymerase ii largest subunit [Cryptosporidium sp. chipmunk genotype I]|uniref:DNA-directed RNA polymerase ii largest subunit n=1 Tax=Cryptosporidium sp. chipmunk genotype I TaxID=1280935 RepID=UPI00351A1606|nr:DNA-directed RNA polymerase ii largest subunit [Cryptosporidium sp. chipmunk genotype I]
MLEQLKLRWISKLNDLCLGVTKDEKSDRTQEWVPTELEVIAPKLDGVLPVKIESATKKFENSEVNNNYSNTEFNDNEIIVAESGIKNKRACEGLLDSFPTPIISSKEMRNVNELNTEYEFCKILSKKSKLEDSKHINDGDKEEGNAFSDNYDDSEKKQDTSIQGLNTEKYQNLDENGNNSNDEFGDDEFGDASWDVVAPSESENTNANITDNFLGQNKPGSSTNNNQNGAINSQIGGSDGNFDEELFSDPGSDLENISDLDDEEPECSDVIIGHFEKVIRPYTRKKSQKGKWRVKLRNGIAQIANQEIPFDTLIGEFEF